MGARDDAVGILSGYKMKMLEKAGITVIYQEDLRRLKELAQKQEQIDYQKNVIREEY